MFNFSKIHLHHHEKHDFEREQREGYVGHLTLREIAEEVSTRKLALNQLLKMAKSYGLEESDIANPNWRGSLIIESCCTCAHRGHCFYDRHGAERDNPGLVAARCPNSHTYQSISDYKKSHQTPKLEWADYAEFT